MPDEIKTVNKWPIPIAVLSIVLTPVLMGLNLQIMSSFKIDEPLSILISYTFSGIIMLLWLSWLAKHYFGSIKTGWSLETPFKAKWFLMVLLVTIGLYVFNFIYIGIVSSLGIKLHEQPAVVMVSQTATPAEILMVFLMSCAFAPLMEELIYRACFYSAIKNRLGFIPGVILSSLVFALMHQSLSFLMPLFAVGVAYALIFEKTKSLTAGVVAHSFFNLTGVSFVYLLQLAEQPI
jgi:membrane protease YdiL (CAAX protease family)